MRKYSFKYCTYLEKIQMYTWYWVIKRGDTVKRTISYYCLRYELEWGDLTLARLFAAELLHTYLSVRRPVYISALPFPPFLPGTDIRVGAEGRSSSRTIEQYTCILLVTCALVFSMFRRSSVIYTCVCTKQYAFPRSRRRHIFSVNRVHVT